MHAPHAQQELDTWLSASDDAFTGTLSNIPSPLLRHRPFARRTSFLSFAAAHMFSPVG